VASSGFGSLAGSGLLLKPAAGDQKSGSMSQDSMSALQKMQYIVPNVVNVPRPAINIAVLAVPKFEIDNCV
jgi:hypothetical protein